ncbi:major facilitator superfamily domain-containing protein [Pseudomassariella vexata]|uniref:Major facilitator superfamily domain-containing protein n=1 Tax=Pseudomassariella vexata TaxID=1141098 RepID=A0A1Y2DGT1_9PEZI|nr:major facilitator superfamily domain-containing protein [Pseudomassariella vexata]ORY58462.1 major facilitator superfamily domain-containing protein [Pseudomassariella vexata]
MEHFPTHGTYIEKEAIDQLSGEHRQYLLHRHGTLDLDPIPGYGDADPYNWTTWKKIANLLLVAFHALMATFTAASIIPAYGAISKDLGVSIQEASYLTSLQIAIIGGAPLFWRPMSNRFGRRPIFILSLICSLVANIGCANSPSYGTMALCRAITAFFICPPSAIGSGVVTEVFFKKERARYLGIWTLMVTLGVPLSPLIFGFVATRLNYRWIYYILAIINSTQLVLYIFLGPETRYIRRGVEHHGSELKQEYMNFHRIDPTPFSLAEFLRPLAMGRHLCIMLPAAAYAMVFMFGSIIITVEVPQLFEEKFEFTPAQIGLQFIGLIIGSILGELIGGYISDHWMLLGTKKTGSRPQPEYRLWLSYIGYLLTITGVVVFLVRLDEAPDGQWNVTPIVGAAIAGGGNQIVTTVLITYAVDCYHEESASVGVFITFVRQIWGFIGPFWFPDMFVNLGLRNSAALCSCLMIGVSIIPTIFLQLKGRSWR